jgi:hypothetical protein
MRYVLHRPTETRDERLDLVYVEFTTIKIKTRKVFRLYGVEDLSYVVVKQEGDPESEDFTLMFYSVGFPETDTEPLIEIVATKNNLKPSTQWSQFTLGVAGRVVEAGIKLKQLKATDYPMMKLKPRCPMIDTEYVKDIPKQNTVGKGDPPANAKEALKFLDELGG